MNGRIFILLLLAAAAAAGPSPAAPAEEGERAVAEWVLRLGGGVALQGSPAVIRHLEKLPPGPLSLETIDLTGTLVEPDQLARLKGLARLRSLYLPAPMWNEGAGSRRESNDALAHLAGLRTLEKLQLSLHFLTNINVNDKGIALLAPLTGLRELRLAQSRVRGSSLAPLVNLRALDLSYAPADDEGMRALAGMQHLTRLLLRDTLVTDAGLRHVAGLAEIEELDLGGCRITDAGLAALEGMTRMRKLNLLGAAVTDAGLAALARMDRLEELNLYRSRVTNAGLELLAGKRKLTALDLRYSRVTRAGVESARARRAAGPRSKEGA